MNLDHTPLTFGCYKGRTPEEVADLDPSYIVWMYSNVKSAPCSEALAWGCKQRVLDGEAERDDLYYP